MAGEVLSGFVADEYARFLQGLRGLSGQDQARRRRDLERRGITPDTPREINMPQWDDIVHLIPRRQITGEEMAEWRASRREGRPPALPDEAIQEIARRENRIEAFRRSAQPEWSQSWGSMLTAMDNIQDFLASVSVAARVVTRVGARFGLRTLPGIGWVRNTSDLLNLMMWIGTAALPGFAALCQGSRQALAAGIASGLVRGGGLCAISLLAEVSPTSRFARLRRVPRLVQRLGSVAAALVVLQTTDQLFGWGVSLGPVVGYAMETVFAEEARRRGQPVRVGPARGTREWYERAHPYLDRLPTEALTDYGAAASTQRDQVAVMATNETWAPAEHLAALVALHLALGILAPAAREMGVHEWEIDPDQVLVPAPRLAAGEVASVELLAEPPPPEAFGWPLPGRPAAAGAAELALALAPRVPESLAGWLGPIQDTPEAALAGVLVNESARALLALLDPDPGLLEERLAPAYGGLRRLSDLRLVVHPGSDPARVERFWQAALRRLEARPAALGRREDWFRLASEYGVELVYLRAPDTRDRPGPGAEQMPALAPA